MNRADFRECCMCARLIEPRDRDECRCHGCGSYVCKLCVHVVIWECEADMPGGSHKRQAHVEQAVALGISVDAGRARSLNSIAMRPARMPLTPSEPTP